MPPHVHRVPFVPPPIGIAYVTVDGQGRIVVPAELRAAFGDRRPPFSILYSLAGPGYVTAQTADGWPPLSERAEVERALKPLYRIDPRTLPADHLKIIQDFVRLVACRYVDGAIDKSWQVRIPETVRAWLGLKTRATGRGGGAPRRPRDKESVIVLGNVGSLEVWSESTFKEALLPDGATFARLRAETAQALVHAGR